MVVVVVVVTRFTRRTTPCPCPKMAEMKQETSLHTQSHIPALFNNKRVATVRQCLVHQQQVMGFSKLNHHLEGLAGGRTAVGWGWGGKWVNTACNWGKGYTMWGTKGVWVGWGGAASQLATGQVRGRSLSVSKPNLNQTCLGNCRKRCPATG